MARANNNTLPLDGKENASASSYSSLLVLCRHSVDALHCSLGRNTPIVSADRMVEVEHLLS